MKNKKILWWFIGGIVLGAIVGFFATAERYGQIDLFRSRAAEPQAREGGEGKAGDSCEKPEDAECAPGLLCGASGTCENTAVKPRLGNTPRPTPCVSRLGRPCPKY